MGHLRKKVSQYYPVADQLGSLMIEIAKVFGCCSTKDGQRKTSHLKSWSWYIVAVTFYLVYCPPILAITEVLGEFLKWTQTFDWQRFRIDLPSVNNEGKFMVLRFGSWSDVKDLSLHTRQTCLFPPREYAGN